MRPSIIIIGAGGAGQWLVHALQYNYDIHLYDKDEFENKNFDRQTGKEGKNKAEYFAEIYPERVTAYPEWFRSETVVDSHIEAIVCAADNNQSRHDAIHTAERRGIPIVITGNEEKSGEAVLYNAFNSDESLNPTKYYDVSQTHDPRMEEACSDHQEDGGQTVMANIMSAAMAIQLLQRVMSDIMIQDSYINHHYFNHIAVQSEHIKFGEMQNEQI